MKKLVIEHRQVRLPSGSLTSPKYTSMKMENSHCRMCGRPSSVRPLTRHHLVPESWFLRQPLKLRVIRNAHANIIPLCRPDHDRIDSRDEDERWEARTHLRRCLTTDELAFAIQVRGQTWLEIEYPRL
jgi:hypothetical protein